VLDYSKAYVSKLAPVLCRGRVVVVGCASRCERCRPVSPFCTCGQGSDCTRVLYRSPENKPCEPLDIWNAIHHLQPQGQTYVAAPIVALPTIALDEVTLQRRQRAQEQSNAFCMGLHPRLGAESPVRRLPHDVLQHILCNLGSSVIHARVIMVVDGDNNVSCGMSTCEHCSRGDEGACPLRPGSAAVTEAVQRLIQGNHNLKINCELNIAMVGEHARNEASTEKLQALCSATGGRYDSVAEEDSAFVAQSFSFFDTTVKHPPSHIKARVQAVQNYTDMCKAKRVLDCGVKTVFVGKDKATWQVLVQADTKRMSLCEKVHGVPCTHGEDRGACLQACQKKLVSPQPFASHVNVSTVHHEGADPEVTRGKLDHLSELLDSSLFVAQTCKLMQVGGKQNVTAHAESGLPAVCVLAKPPSLQ